MRKSFNQYLIERHDGEGDCMIAAANLMMRFNSAFFGKPLKSTSGKPMLVHALVYGQGSVSGLRFPHAWVEDGDIVIDQSNGNDIRMDKRVYYALGRIKPNEKGAYKAYTYIEMTRKLKSTNHYGPWDLNEALEETTFISSPRKIGKRKVGLDLRLSSFLREEVDVDEAIISGRPTTGHVRGYTQQRAYTQEPQQQIPWNDLKRLESVLDAMFASAKLDIAFTRHFWERMNGSRGYGGTVTIPEIQDAFRKTYAKHAQKIKDHPVDWKAIIHDVSKSLNMPFTLEWDGKMKKMVMMTAMKKTNFMSPDPKLAV
jgi:hypothetical protein